MTSHPALRAELIQKLSKTLIESAKNPRHTHILQLTKALVFFGVPHDGLQTSSLIHAISPSASEKFESEGIIEILEQLTPGSDYLENLRDDVKFVLDNLKGRRVISFYETARTRDVKAVSSWLGPGVLRIREMSDFGG